MINSFHRPPKFVSYSVGGIILRLAMIYFGTSFGESPSTPVLMPIRGVIVANPNFAKLGGSACFPEYACAGININEIPYILNHVHATFVNERTNSLFDRAKTQNCLLSKRVLVLGDNIM